MKIKLLFLLTLVFMLNTSLFTQSAHKKDFPLLSEIYKSEKEPIGFTFVIDRSSSLKKKISNKDKITYWDEIKTSILKVVSLMNYGDYVVLVGFDSKSGILKGKDNAGKEFEIIPRTVKNREDKELLVKQIQSVGEPSGNFTNLYDSLDFVLEKCINRPGVQNFQVVFFFTDFLDDPPGIDVSEYGDPSKKSKLMQGLKDKYNNYVIKSGRFVNTFAFQLPLDQQAGKDFDEFASIIDQNVNRIIVQDNKAMNEWFENLRDTLLRERFKLQFATNIKNAISVKPLKQTYTNIEIEIANQLPMEVQIKSIILEDKEGQKGKKDYKDLFLKVKENKVVSIPTSLKVEKVSFDILFDKKYSPEFAKLNMTLEHNASITIQDFDQGKSLPTYALWIIGIYTLLFVVMIVAHVSQGSVISIVLILAPIALYFFSTYLYKWGIPLWLSWVPIEIYYSVAMVISGIIFFIVTFFILAIAD